MGHFYEKTDTDIFLRDDVETAPQCRKANLLSEGFPVLPSVTTKLGILPNGFLDIWKLKEAARIAREDLDIELDDIPKEVWGRRKSPSGVLIYSSDFGTICHKHLELACIAHRDGNDDVTPDGWAPYVDPFISWIETNFFTILECEYMVANDVTAGMIDLVVRDEAGKIALMDFKTRVGKGKLKSKAYEKDAAQLAIEAEIYADDYDLPYSPNIYSVLIDCDTAELCVKKWTRKAQEKALETFQHCSTFYDAINGL